VDDDVAGVDQHPLARLLALDADDPGAGLLQPVADVMSERLDLPVRVGAAMTRLSQRLVSLRTSRT